MNVNGELTLGENIGDLAGLTVAYEAYQISLGGKPAPVIDGFTGDQRFFLGWAQVWRASTATTSCASAWSPIRTARPSSAPTAILRNMPAFDAAFDVKEGDKLYLPPDQVVRIW